MFVMLFKYLRRFKQIKHHKALEKSAVFGKAFCERPLNGEKISYLYTNVKIKNSFGRDHVVFGDYNNVSVSIYLTKNGQIKTGNYVYMNSGCKLHINNKLTIGHYCMFGPGVTIWDSDNHPINPDKRREDAQQIPKGSLNAFDVGGETL